MYNLHFQVGFGLDLRLLQAVSAAPFCLALTFTTLSGCTSVWPDTPLTFKHEGGVPQKSSENKNGPEWSPLLVCQKKFRWTARGRTWSSSPSSARTSSKHEGAVPQKSSENKNGPEWSPLLVHQKKIEVDSEGKDME